MISAAVRVAITGTALAAILVATGTADPGRVPDEYRDPSDSQIADSIVTWSPEGSVVDVASTEEQGQETVVTLRSDILFDFGSAELSSQAVAAIAETSAAIPSGTAVSVIGHTDDVGTDPDNLTLSQTRADAVATAIGRTDLALDVAGRGETDPVVPNTDAEGQRQNRRVEIRYVG